MKFTCSLKILLSMAYNKQVSIDIEHKNLWKECFSIDNVRLPTGYYLGVTAATGQLSGN